MDNNNIKRRALGKGLEELFNNEQINFDQIEEKILDSTSVDEIVELPVDELRSNPYQPRKVFDEEKLQELAQSIKEHGVFQPIIVKKSSIKGYEIIAGERRVKACKIAEVDKIPAIVRDFSDQQMMEIALLENLQRENLNSIEEAMAYKQLLNNLKLTQEQLAERLGKSRSHITNMIGLLNLPKQTQDLISSKKITMGHARVLSKLEDEEKINSLASQIILEGLSVRQLEDITSSNDKFERKNKITRVKQAKNHDYDYLEEELSEKLGTKVKVKNTKLEITFANSNDLNRILEIMNLNK